MAAKLSEKQVELLKEVIMKQHPDMLQNIDDLSKPDVIEDLCDAIMSKFCETGLNPADEPNQRGLLLEGLIDSLRE